MFCRNCGIQNADGMPTCTACGAALDRVNPYQAAHGAVGGPPPGQKPNNYLVYAILVTLCCCLPLGIVGIVYAAQVDSKWNVGDFHGAITAAGNAKTWTLAGFGIGLVVQGAMVLLQIAAIGAAGVGGGNF